MQHRLKLVRTFSSPTALIVAVWSALLLGIAIGPIDYPNQPSIAAIALVVVGISLFILAQQAGAWCFRIWLENQPSMLAPPRTDRLSRVVAISSCAGVAGIGLIALDRIVLSGVNNGGYAELLRCAPDLIDIIEIKRTPLLYLGYLLFSFGFASLVLFLLKGEQIRGWTAVLAQLSILSPIGYALLYAGRMPILFVILLSIAAMLVRLTLDRPPLPEGHHLFVKLIVLVLIFGIYSSAVWSRRQTFCTQMSGVVRALHQRMQDREAEQAKARPSQQAAIGQQPSAMVKQEEMRPSISQPSQAAGPDRQPPRNQNAGESPAQVKSSTDAGQSAEPADVGVSAADLGKMIVAGKARPRDSRPEKIATLVAIMDQAWHVRPRGYVISAMKSGYLPPGTAVAVLSTYFYFSHGVRILDTTWRERDRFSPHWGVYEIGVLSPILRVFLPENRELASLKTELQSAGLHGFFPTVWAAAYIDFGAVGAVIYILVWGFMGGWSLAGSRRSGLVTPLLLLVFVLASILLSPVAGPLGIANSALVLLSMLVTGCTLDFANLRSRSSRNAEPRSSAF